MIRVITVNVVGMVTTDLGSVAVARPVPRPVVQQVPFRGVRGFMAPRALVVVLALVSGAGVASAAPLVWRAPSGCPDAADVRTRIERRVGSSIAQAVHGIEITVVRERGAYVATIDARALTVANDVRTLRSARCDELADAVAVIVARLASEARGRGTSTANGAPDTANGAWDPANGAWDTANGSPAGRIGHRRSDTAHQDAESTHLNAIPDDARAVARDRGPDDEELGLVNRVPPMPDDRKWGGGGHVRGLSGAGALPSLNVGVELAGHVRRFDRFIEVGAGLWIPQSAHLQVGAPARVDVSLQVISLRGGWSPRDLPLRAWLTAEVGRIQGIGIAVDDPRAGSSRWTALGGGFNVAWPMSPVARLVGAVELMIPVERTVFMLEDGRDLYRPSSAAARCSLGIEVGWK